MKQKKLRDIKTHTHNRGGLQNLMETWNLKGKFILVTFIHSFAMTNVFELIEDPRARIDMCVYRGWV